MKEALRLFTELLEMARAQKKALAEGRYDEVLKLQQKRREITDRINNIKDKGPEAEDSSRVILNTIEKILAIDNECKTAVQSEMDPISDQIGNVTRARSFLRNVPRQKAEAKLDISA